MDLDLRLKTFFLSKLAYPVTDLHNRLMRPYREVPEWW
jgi:hypothetical protein